MDEIFMSLNSLSLLIFLIEIILSSLCLKGYFLQFYFWLDLIATLSLISDITWIWYPIIGVQEDLQNFNETG